MIQFINSLDSQSLFAALLVTHLAALVCALMVLITREGFRGAHYWIAGQALGVFALFMTVISGEEYDILRILANLGYLISAFMFIIGMWKLRFGKGLPVWNCIFTGLAGLVFICAGPLGVATRMVLYSAILMVQYGYLFLITVWKARPQHRVGAWLAGIPFFFLALGNLVRIPINLVNPAERSLQHANDFNNLLYLLSAATAFLIFFGFFLLYSRKTDQDLADKQAEILRKNQELERVNQDNNTIISLIAHDLASPLNSAARLVNRHLNQPDLTEEKRLEYCQVLGDSLDYSSELLQKVLIWARSSHESFQLNPSDISPELFDQDIFPSLIAQAQAKNISLDWELSGLESGFRTDPAVLSLLIHNLTVNAIKFTKPGGRIRVRCICSPGKELVCSVQDTGVGMAPDYLQAVLTGTRARSSRGTEGENGSGLGLQLCRNFLYKAGGLLMGSSKPGEGTTLSFTLPWAD